MRGLMAKPTGEIIETPIKANFREGLTVLEYFSSTHGARKGLADTALKTADSGYLTRKLADVAQNVVVTMEDCNTARGITKGVIYRGEKVEVRLADAINGRVSQTQIAHLVTGEVIVAANEMITPETAKRIEELGVDKIQVRSPMTCEAPLGICRKCYGMDLSTGQEVEAGMAVGIIAAQSIGEPGTQLTMRTFHIGGTVNTSIEESDMKSQTGGIVKFVHIRNVTNVEGDNIVLTRNGEIAILDAKGRELESYTVPTGALLRVNEDDEVKAGTILCEWDPHSIPILAEVSGVARYEDIVDGETLRLEKDAGGSMRRMITDHKGELHPQIILEDADGKPKDVYYLPEGAHIEVDEGEKIKAGSVIAKTPREASGVSDITGGLPRITEIFEARKPKDPAVIAEIDGVIEITGDKKRGKRQILIRNEESGMEFEHLVPPGKRFLVHSGDVVQAGKELVDGPLEPHDILRVTGEEEVQRYLTREVQQVYRSQRVEINDKHIEVIIARMLRKVQIRTAGDTTLLTGMVMDKIEVRQANEALAKCLKIKDAGDTNFQVGEVIPKTALETANAAVEAEGGSPAKGTKPKPATSDPQLLGITKASVQSSSFISAASFQETTKVLTEAALSGKVDRLVGLKENVILGHLIPAGTGFRKFQAGEVRYEAEALQALAAEDDQSLVTQFPLLQAGEEEATPEPVAEAPAEERTAQSLEELLGDGDDGN